jgi:hypothetical protein
MKHRYDKLCVSMILYDLFSEMLLKSLRKCVGRYVKVTGSSWSLLFICIRYVSAQDINTTVSRYRTQQPKRAIQEHRDV